jgi:hypothetical protein
MTTHFPARTHLIENGLASTFWGRRIIGAEEKGRFTRDDRDLAEGWTTCACGKSDPRIPRSSSGIPLDHQMSVNGIRFYRRIFSHNFLEAAQTLVLIERRATELIREQGIKP